MSFGPQDDPPCLNIGPNEDMLEGEGECDWKQYVCENACYFNDGCKWYRAFFPEEVDE